MSSVHLWGEVYYTIDISHTMRGSCFKLRLARGWSDLEGTTEVVAVTEVEQSNKLYVFRTTKCWLLSEQTLHQEPLRRLCCLTTSLAARMGDRPAIKTPHGKHTVESAASTANQTVSRRVLSWSKKPIGLCAAARAAQEQAHSKPLTSQRPTMTHDG